MVEREKVKNGRRGKKKKKKWFRAKQIQRIEG